MRLPWWLNRPPSPATRRTAHETPPGRQPAVTARPAASRRFARWPAGCYHLRDHGILCATSGARMAVYDQAARYAVKLDPAGLFRWLLPGLVPGLAFARWLDTQSVPFPGDPDR